MEGKFVERLCSFEAQIAGHFCVEREKARERERESDEFMVKMEVEGD